MITLAGSNHIVGVRTTVPRWLRVFFAFGRHVTTVYVLPRLRGSIRQLPRSNTDDRAISGVQLANLCMPFPCHIPESIGYRGRGKKFGPRVFLEWMEKDIPYRAENEYVAQELR